MATTKFKGPRMIQSRHPCFNISLGRFIKPLEHKFYRHQNTIGEPPHIYKCMTLHEQGEALLRTLRMFKHPVFVLLDHTEFDAHITTDHIRGENEFNTSRFHPKHRRELRTLQNNFLRNRCKTRNGVSYKTIGTRMSGDVTTGYNNSVTNYCILEDVFEDTPHFTIVNGDDSIVIVEAGTPLPDVSTFRRYNMETKIDRITDVLEEVEFCQNRLVILDDGSGYMMPNMERILSRFGRTNKIDSLPGPDKRLGYHQYCSEVAHCLATLFKPVKEVNEFWLRVEALFDSGYQLDIRNYHRSLAIRSAENDAQPYHVSRINESISRAYPNIHQLLNEVPTLVPPGIKILDTRYHIDFHTQQSSQMYQKSEMGEFHLHI